MAADFEKFFLKSKYLHKLIFHYLIILIIVCVVYCNSSEECAKNNCVHGRCEAGKCVCDPGFRGTSCNSCGGRIRLSGAEGSISDGPGNYTEDNQCSWLIDASAVIPLHSNASSSSSDSEHPIIRLQLGHFATECSWDHLYVYDGDSVYAPLLAVYSGLVVSDGYRSTVVPELVTTSGFALVHFYSDAAYNLTGFDVNYRVGGCAGGLNSSGSWIECSGRGSCLGGACHCEGGWAGPDCGRRTCPRHCSSNGHCNTEHGACDCHPQFTGSDCSESVQAVHWRALQFLLPSDSSASLSPQRYQRTDASQQHRSSSGGGGGNRHSHARRALRRSFGPDGEFFRLVGGVPDDRGRFPPPRRRRYHRATVYERPGPRCCQPSPLTITGDTPSSGKHGGSTATSFVGRSPEAVGDGAATLGSSNMEGPGSDNNNIYNGDDVILFENAVRPVASVFDQGTKYIASSGHKHAADAVQEVHIIPVLGEGLLERDSYHPETKEIRRFPRSIRDNVNNLAEMGDDGVGSSLGHTDGNDGVGSSLGHTDGDDGVGSSQWYAVGDSGARSSDDNNLNDGDSSRSGSSIVSSINKINNNEALTDNNDFSPTGGYFSPKYGFEFLGEEHQQMFDPRDFGIVMTTSNELPAMIAGGGGLASEGIFGVAGAGDEPVNYGVSVEQHPSESVLPLQDVRTDPDLSSWFDLGSAPHQGPVASGSNAITQDNRLYHSSVGSESNLPEQHQADRYQMPNVQFKIDTNTIPILRPFSAPHHTRFRGLHPTMAPAAPYLSREFISGPTPWMSFPLLVRIPSHWWWRHQQQYVQPVLPSSRQHHPSFPPGPLPHPQLGAGGMNAPPPLYQDPNASFFHPGFPWTNHPLVFHPPMAPPPFRHPHQPSTPWRRDHPPSQFVRFPIPRGIPRHSARPPHHEPLQYTARQLQQLSRHRLGIQIQPNFETRHVDESNPRDGSTWNNQLRMNQPSFVPESGHFGSSKFDSKNTELPENRRFIDESLNFNNLFQQGKNFSGFHSRAEEFSESSTTSRPAIESTNTNPPSSSREKNTDNPQFSYQHHQVQSPLPSIFDQSSSNPSPVSDPSRPRSKRSPLSRSADDFLVSNFPPDLHSEPSGGDLPSTRSLHHPLLERSSMASVVVGDVVWVLGGYSFTPLPFVLRYNVSAGVVEGVVAKGNREPSSRHGHTALYHNGSVFVFGGMLLDGVVTPQLWRFSPDSLKWSHLGTRRGDGNGSGGTPRHPWDGVSAKGGARIATTGKRSAGNKRGQRNSEERSPSAGAAAEIQHQGDGFELFGGGDNTTEVVKGGEGGSEGHGKQEEDFGAYLKRKYPDIYEAQFHSQHNKSFSPESEVGEEVAALAKQLSAKESSSAKIHEDATNEVKIRKDIWNKLFSSSSEDPHNRWFPQHSAEGGSDDLSVPESNDAWEGSGSSDSSVVAHAIHDIRKRMAQAVGNPKSSNVGDEDVEEDSSGGATSSSKFSHASLAEDDHHHDDHPLKSSTFLGDGADEDQEEGSPSSRLYSDSPSSNSLNANHNADGGSFFGGGDCRRRGSGLCAPIGVVGAGAVVVPPEDQEALDDAVMLVIFGYSPPYGFINAVQEYHFSSNSWRLVPCGGAIVRGRYGHTVTWDAVSRLVLVHGGLVAATSTSNVVNGLLAYSHSTRNWHILPPSPSSVYLHSAAVLSPGALVVFGGNSHNDTSVSHSARCYTHASSLYDTVCGYWAEGVPRPRPTELGVDTARYGHNMVVMRAPHSIQPSSIPSPEGGDKDHNKPSGVTSSSSAVSASATVGLVLGGFNGRMLGTALVLHHGLCQRHSGARDCLNAYPGVKCVWNSVLSQCELYDPDKDESSYTICLHELRARDSTSSGSSRKRSSEPSVPPPPPTTAGSRLTTLFAHHHRNDSLSLCRLQADCLSCLFTSFGCVWCGTGGCQYEKCVAPKSKAVSIPSECSPGAEFPYRCRALSSCQHCHQSRFLIPGQQAHSCVWLSNNQCAHNNSTASSYPATTTTENASPDAVEGGRVVSSSSDLSNAGLKVDELGKTSGDEATSTVTPTAVSVPSSTATVDAMDVMPQKYRACHQPPCHLSTTCGNCTMGQCMWCFSQQRCVNNNSYLVSFPYGSCREWTTSPRSCLAIKHGENGCSLQRSCSSCQSSVGCGWCDDGSGSGTGACVAGGAAGPRHPLTGDPAPAACPRHRWHFTTCPACNCNGHSRCRGLESPLSLAEGGGNQLPVSGDRTTAPPSAAGGAEGGFEPSECVQPCGNNTEGPHCQYCRPTFYGVAINGGLCKPCACNDHGVHCDRDTGRCFCSTKGVTGDHCQRCDTQNNYFGDPLNGSCFYDLQIDYQFTFNLSKAEDRHVRQINFFNVPTKPNVDTDFDISSSKPARLKISAKETGGHEVWVVRNFTGTRIKRRFSHTDYAFGTPDNNTTFHVYVYNFTPPVEIVVSFSQYPKLNLLGFFYIFLLCFLCLLVVAALLWKIKQKYDIYSRRQRLMVEMEAMASRPFKPVLLELQPHQYPPPVDHRPTPPHSPSPLTARHTNGGAHHTASKNLNVPSPMASPIALEVCEGGRAAVLSLLVQLPTGGRDYMPYLHPGGLAIASTLVSLGSHRNGATGGGHNTDPLTLTGGGTSLSSTNSNPTTVTTTGHHRGGEGGGGNTGVGGTNPSSPVVPKSSSIIRSGRGVSFQLPGGSQPPGTATTSCNSTTSSDNPSRRARSGSGAVTEGTRSDVVTADRVNVGTSTTTVDVVGAVVGSSPTSSSESNSSKRSTSSTNTNSKDEASTTGSSAGSPKPLSVANSNVSIDVVVTNSIVNCSNTSSSPSTTSLRHISDLPVTICNNINDINHNNKITSVNSSSSVNLNSSTADDRYDAGTTLSSSINNNNSPSHVSYAPATPSPIAGDALTIVNTNALHCDPHEGEEGARAAATCILNTARTSPLLSAGEVSRQSSPGFKAMVGAVTIANHHADDTVGPRENSSSSQPRRLKEPTASFSAYRSRDTPPEVSSSTARRQRPPPTGREEDSCPDVPVGEFSLAWGSPVHSSLPATAPSSHGAVSTSSSNGVGYLGRPVVPRTSLTTSVDLSSSRVSTHPSSVTVNGKQLATCI